MISLTNRTGLQIRMKYFEDRDVRFRILRQILEHVKAARILGAQIRRTGNRECYVGKELISMYYQSKQSKGKVKMSGFLACTERRVL